MTQNPVQTGVSRAATRLRVRAAIRRNSPAWLSASAARSPADIHRSSPADIRRSSHRQQGYPPQGSYGPQRAYGPPPGGYPPQPPEFWAARAGGRRPGTQGAPAKKSPVMIIAIVAAAIVLLAAVGGIIMVLTRGGTDQPDVIDHPEPAGYRRRSSRPRNPRGSRRHNRNPHRPSHRNRRPAAPSISVTGSSSYPPPAGRSRRPVRTWRSCPTARASSWGNRCRSRRPPTRASCAMHGIGMSPRARPTASSRMPRTPMSAPRGSRQRPVLLR